MAAKKQTRKYVVVRTYTAGVHCGELVKREGKEVTLANARRIWRWFGANTINEIANHGAASNSKVSEAVSEIELTEAIEVVTCSAEGRKALEAATWAA